MATPAAGRTPTELGASAGTSTLFTRRAGGGAARRSPPAAARTQTGERAARAGEGGEVAPAGCGTGMAGQVLGVGPGGDAVRRLVRRVLVDGVRRRPVRWTSAAYWSDTSVSM